VCSRLSTRGLCGLLVTLQDHQLVMTNTKVENNVIYRKELEQNPQYNQRSRVIYVDSSVILERY
jgi:hypothetical protein